MSVYVQMEIEGRYALSILTRDWSPAEIEALLGGDEGAKKAAVEEAEYLALRMPDDSYTTHVEVNLFDFRKKSA